MGVRSSLWDATRRKRVDGIFERDERLRMMLSGELRLLRFISEKSCITVTVTFEIRHWLSVGGSGRQKREIRRRATG